jgi:uncharacterized SAM-binding protein YcdF (DUF218 family)
MAGVGSPPAHGCDTLLFLKGDSIMSLYLLCGLLLVGYVLGRRGRRRLGRAFYGLALVLFLLEGCGPLPFWLLGRLQAPFLVRPAIVWAPRNAIVLLAAGSVPVPADSQVEPTLFAYGRIVEAVALYHACKQSGNDCRLDVTGGDPQRHGVPEAVAYGNVMQRLGVDKTDLWIESHSMSTWQNAQFSRPLLAAYKAQQTLLVSSGTHLKRAQMSFAHFGIVAIPVRADYLDAKLSVIPVFWNFLVTDVALHEYGGMLLYHFYNAMGWNGVAIKPMSP